MEMSGLIVQEWFVTFLRPLKKLVAITRNDDSFNEDDDIVSMERKRVKMTLDCKLLIWLPLPPAARRAVARKIIAVFESVAVAFFDELATVVWNGLSSYKEKKRENKSLLIICTLFFINLDWISLSLSKHKTQTHKG